MMLQADPTVIYAMKLKLRNFDTIIKRVLYKDLTINSPYNTYRYNGLRSFLCPISRLMPVEWLSNIPICIL